MAKRKRENSEKQNEKKIKEGRGQGRFEKYQPWLRIQDVGSQGLATRIRGTKTGRIHQLLSTLELDYLYLLDWFEDVIDIREQYPLDLNETIALAKEADIPHPPLSNPGKPVVMTTDFLVTVRQPIGTKDIARTVKYSKDLINKRVLEKFEIERLYWRERNIDWGIITDLDINKILVKNVKWIYKFRPQNSLPSTLKIELIPKISDFLLHLINEKHPLKIATNEGDKKFALPKGNCLALVRHLIATREWKVDMFRQIQPETVMVIVKNQGEKR